MTGPGHVDAPLPDRLREFLAANARHHDAHGHEAATDPAEFVAALRRYGLEVVDAAALADLRETAENLRRLVAGSPVRERDDPGGTSSPAVRLDAEMPAALRRLKDALADDPERPSWAPAPPGTREPPVT